jgi:hypothetical protein
VLPGESKHIPTDIQPGEFPFTIEEFQQRTGRGRHDFINLFSQKREMPKLMSGELYTPGLQVTLYGSDALDSEGSLILPSNGVFFINKAIPKKDDWVYEVTINQYGRDYTMYVPEKELYYAGFYGQGPASSTIAAYEAKRVAMTEKLAKEKADLEADYQLALDEYWAAYAIANPAPKSFSIDFSGLSSAKLTTTQIFILCIIGMFTLVVVIMAVIMIKSNRSTGPREVTLKELMEAEDESEHSEEEKSYYSPFSERGADFYDTKEDEDLANKRF